MSTLETGENFLGTAEKLLVDAAGEMGFTPQIVGQYRDEALEIFGQIANAMNPNTQSVEVASKNQETEGRNPMEAALSALDLSEIAQNGIDTDQVMASTAKGEISESAGRSA